MWEAATLVVKKEGFSIKGSGSNSNLLMEKFSPAPTVCFLSLYQHTGFAGNDILSEWKGHRFFIIINIDYKGYSSLL